MAGADRSRADSAIIEALLLGRKIAQVAEDANVSERTVYRRLNNANFQTMLGQARAARQGRLSDVVAEYAYAAVAKVARYLVDDVNDPHLGMSAYQFHRCRLQATGQLFDLHAACRTSWRDEEVRRQAELLAQLERDVEDVKDAHYQGGPDGYGWPRAAG
jgi:hypothetical protein